MDHADLSQDYADREVQKKLKHISTTPPPFSGYCICCAEPVFDRRFCDSDCREVWENKPKTLYRKR